MHLLQSRVIPDHLQSAVHSPWGEQNVILEVIRYSVGNTQFDCRAAWEMPWVQITAVLQLVNGQDTIVAPTKEIAWIVRSWR